MKSKALYADLNERIQVREVINTPSSSGGMETTYNVKTTVWGRVRPLSVNQQINQQIGNFIGDSQVNNQPTHVMRLRVNTELEVTRTGLQGNMYLYIEDKETKGRSFRILAVVDKDDRGIELNILVREMGIQYGTDDLLL